jgi:hypothetical protein
MRVTAITGRRPFARISADIFEGMSGTEYWVIVRGELRVGFESHEARAIQRARSMDSRPDWDHF